MAWTDIADYIIDQLWGSAKANTLKANVEYIEGTVLGSPSQNSDKPSAAAANNFRNVTTRPTGTSVALGGYALSASCGLFSTTSASYVDVTNLSVTIITNGRPVLVGLISDGDAVNLSFFGVRKSGGGSTGAIYSQFKILRDAVTASQMYCEHGYPSSTSTAPAQEIPISALSYIDLPIAGTYVYKLQALAGPDSSVEVFRGKLFAIEL